MRLAWSARRVVAMFGRILARRPARGERRVTVTGALGSADADVFSQIEAATDEVMSVLAADGRWCRLPLRPPE